MYFYSKQSIIYRRVQEEEMSGMIDDIIFQTLDILQSRQNGLAESTLVYEMFQKLKVNQRYPIVHNDSKNYETHNTYDTTEKSFLVNLYIKKPTRNCTFTAVQVNQITNHKIESKHKDLLKMRQCLKHCKNFPTEANVYINKGKTYLIMNNFLSLSKLQKTSKLIDIYNTFILKNLMNFENFIKKYLENTGSKTQKELEKLTVFRNQLQIARILNTTHSTSNIAIDKSQFKFANSSFQKLKDELYSIKQNINPQLWVQKSAPNLFQSVPEEVNTSWLKQNYIPFYLSNQKILNSTLTLIVNNSQKKLDDFVYNMAKIEIKEMIGGNKPVNQGGFSYIYGARADVTFISSMDLQKLPQNNQKNQKFIAIKKLKPTELKRARNKLEHEKAIMNKMRGSICQFMPKYYGTQKQSELSNTLVMQLIKGDELDYYIQSRADSITLCSKLYLLLNVIQAVRHLINYRITHLDLKPINVLVTKSMVTKLIDYGESYHPDLCLKDYVPGITFPYTAPQVFVRYIKFSYKKPDDDWQYSQKQDAYSFGVIMYEMFFGGTVFPFTNNKFKEVYLKRQSFKRFFLAPQRVYDYGENLIMSHILYMIVRCLDPDPAKRPCFEWIGICLKLIQNSFS